MRWTAHHAEVLAALATMESNSFDACLTDVPYGLGSHQPTPAELLAYLGGAELDTGGDFMGRDWHVPSVHTWKELFRVLKPGAWLLTFGGPRTVDLVSLGVRMGGFEVRDVITYAWWFGTGYPHSQDAAKAIDIAAGHVFDPLDYEPISDLAKQWDGHGTSLKPAFEPIILARKPLDGLLADNIEKHWTGALDIGGARIATDWSERPESWKRSGHSAKPDAAKIAAPPGNGIDCHPDGRWPSHLVMDEHVAEMLDATTGNAGAHGRSDAAYEEKRNVYNMGLAPRGAIARDPNGGPSRFSYITKASREERDLGCEHLPMRSAAETTGSKEGAARLKNPRTGAGRTSGARNHCPCAKPVALTRWLAGLPLPPSRDGVPRRILIPYAGSGSEMIGALLAGWDDVVGIERDPEFLPILRARVSLAEKNPRAFEPYANRKSERVSAEQVSLF
jgi:hypothetical protein